MSWCFIHQLVKAANNWEGEGESAREALEAEYWRKMEKLQILEQFKGQARLPKFAIPQRYDLYLKPDLSACTFSGTVQVDLSIIENTKFLVLNALELIIHEVLFTSSNNQVTSPSTRNRKPLGVKCITLWFLRAFKDVCFLIFSDI